MTVDGGRRLTELGLAAAVCVARERGLPADDPRVLSSRGNLQVHLAPAPVVARVATLTAWTRRDPFVWLAREVAVAGYAARRGAPIVPPTDLVDPGPVWSEGFTVSLWSYLSTSGRRVGSAESGEALGRLHAALVGYPAALPTLAPVHEQVDDGLAALERAAAVDAEQLVALRAVHEKVVTELDGLGGASIVLHGDSHPGNLLHAKDTGGWRWIDLEETCRGPREWDLAVLTGARGIDAATVLRAYTEVTGITPTGDLTPFHRARDLEGAVWALGMAHQYPARYRQVAGELLDRVRSRLPRPDSDG
ncbi:MAG: phosphotransferase [Sciscionella sp.]